MDSKRFLFFALVFFLVLSFAAACGDDDDDDDQSASDDDDDNDDDTSGPASDDDDNDDVTPPLACEAEVEPVNSDNPLSRKVVVTCNERAAISGFVTTPGEEGVGFSDPPISETGLTHFIWFYGLLEDTTYDLIVHEAGETTALAHASFTTPTLPGWLPQLQDYRVAEDADPGYWISAVNNTPGESVFPTRVLIVFDRQARPRFVHEMPLAGEFHPLQSQVVFSNGDIGVSTTTNLVGVKKNGKAYRLFNLALQEGYFRPAHHQFYVADREAEMAMVLYNDLGPGVQCDLTTPTDEAVGDGVVFVGREGEEIWRWSVFDHADVIRPDMMNPFVCYNFHFGPGKYDWTHGNGVIPVPGETAVLISLRNVLQLVKVDVLTGDVIWQMGPDLDFTWLGDEPEMDRWFRMQHDPVYVTPTRLLILDNGNCRYNFNCLDGPWTRALEIEIDEDAMTVTQVWEHRVDFSHAQGNVQRLANGNTLIYNGWQGQFWEVTHDHQEVMYGAFSAVQKTFDLRSYPALWDYDAEPPVK
ncbi:MAG: aryl-sulfate sulfotransferase [Candidatus Lernaella stagnicola]|nr:aryl-sulfate sulfotransferase [Candidatus Lernaella stagnicola]